MHSCILAWDLAHVRWAPPHRDLDSNFDLWLVAMMVNSRSRGK
jgi:hypothetical protein